MQSQRSFFFFFNDTAPTEISPLPLHDALPICLFSQGLYRVDVHFDLSLQRDSNRTQTPSAGAAATSGEDGERSEEHTSELQSHLNLVCRLLLEKKKIYNTLQSLTDASAGNSAS